MKTIVIVVGARPNFVKAAAVIDACKRREGAINAYLIHTGQHYEYQLSKAFFRDLRIPEPFVNLDIGSGERTEQMRRIMQRIEPVLSTLKPHAVVVVGDVTSTVAAALAAVKLGIPVAHVEAGLRSFKWSMPEEVNRVMTDHVSTYLYASEPSAVLNLKRELIPAERIRLAGNVMIDTLSKYGMRIDHSPIMNHLSLIPKGYAVLTMHRPENVDDTEKLHSLVSTIEACAQEVPIVYPLHPRTRERLKAANFILETSHITFIEPCAYLDFIALMKHSKFVMTDSGGIQEETTALGIPCLTLREETERPITVQEGTNEVVGTDPERIRSAVTAALNGQCKNGTCPTLWDGKAGERIVDHLVETIG